MDNWRPTNWKNPYRTLDDLSEAELDCLEDILPANAAKMEHDAFEDGANKMLKALTEEIEKVENPNVGTGEDEELISTVARQAFEQCRYKILVLSHDVNKLDKEEK